MSHQTLSGKQDPHDTITSDDILGKDVIDPEGEFLGVVEKLHIHKKKIEVVGISIDKGFLKKGLLIGKGYIQRVTPHAIFLHIRPLLNVRGMKVFDYEGKLVGTVDHVDLSGGKNQLKQLVIRSGVLRRKTIIKPTQIKSMGENIFLNDKKENILD